MIQELLLLFDSDEGGMTFAGFLDLSVFFPQLTMARIYLRLRTTILGAQLSMVNESLINCCCVDCRYRMPDMDIAHDCYVQRLSHGANIAEMETKLHQVSGLPPVYQTDMEAYE